MASNVFQSLMPTGPGRSFYEDLRRGHPDPLDVEDRVGLLDQENLNHDFQDFDLDSAEGLCVDDSHITMDPRASASNGVRRHTGLQSNRENHDDEEDADKDPTRSLLVELHDGRRADRTSRRKQTGPQLRPIPGPATSRPQWELAQTQQQLHSDGPASGSRHGGNAAPRTFLAGLIKGNAKEMAEWRWANTLNLDIFIKDVYDYYQGCGAWCIFLDRILHLINVAFVAVLLTFFTQCIDYSKLRGSQKLSQILVPQCTTNMSGLWNFVLWMFAFYFIWKSIQYLLDVSRILHLRDFYIHLLKVPDQDMQTITWQEIVARIMALRDRNPKTAANLTTAQKEWSRGSQSKERLDASDIANRLMRRENYLIALFNKDILDLTIPIPRQVPFLQGRQLMSKTVEWSLMFTIIDFVFDEKGQVNQAFLKSDRRGILSAKLRERFKFTGIMILVFSPFVVGYLVVVYILTYYNEFQKKPESMSSRSYTALARWKFRNFNELPHMFERRLNESDWYAKNYLEQFPKVKTEMVLNTIAFLAGSLLTVLAIVTFLYPEILLGLELTQDGTVFVYMSALAAIWKFAHDSVKSNEKKVFEPERALRDVIAWTHHMPDHWKDNLHSAEVHKEFSELYQLKYIIFLQEILSILTTPFVLFSSLTKCSDQIIDFFRDFTLHQDGLGYICHFAAFDFKREPSSGRGAPGGTGADVRDDYYSTKHGKMEASIHGFLNNYTNTHSYWRAGGPSHQPPGLRHPFRPPPPWPTMGSPTLAADMRTSRLDRSEHARSRAPATNTRSGAVVSRASPRESAILLDTRHQPSNLGFSTHRTNAVSRQRAQNQGEDNIIEEESESGGFLDGSGWQTSPPRELSRENSGAEEPDAGVLQMIYQLTKHT